MYLPRLRRTVRLDDLLDIIRACRRSRVKYRVYRALHELGIATPAELADKAKTTVDRVYQVMVGDDGDYRRETSLLAIRVAEHRGLDGVEAFTLTTRGIEAFADIRERLER